MCVIAVFGRQLVEAVLGAADDPFRLTELEPERVIARGAGQADTPYKVLSTLVDRGLRARLQTGSLLTGALRPASPSRPW